MSMLQIGLIDEDVFLQMRDAYMGMHEQIDRDEVLAKISMMDRMIDEHMEDLDGNKALAICILLQGRNFLAQLIGTEQLRAPRGVARLIAESTGKPLPVAIYCPYPLWQESLNVVLSSLVKLISSEYYIVVNSLADICDYIVHDEFIGIISVSPDGNGMIESSVRFELKKLPGWSAEKAEAIELPPCKDLQMKIAKIVFTIQDMHELPPEQMRDPEMILT